ncbi:hypothetical protein FRB94_003703 [Tulasnella sp. JGI-2019a]|nr:hypothetical protein FRB94_003703 [Tulasnella sp. JGI-2019a]
MFANPEFSFPGRKNVSSPSPNTNDTSSSIPRSSSRNSMHGRQISLSSPVSPQGRGSGSNTPIPSSRPASGSHHRRRSSVSSRRESREMMGIAIDNSADEQPVAGGSSVDQRQRALWALEGKKPSPVNTLILGFSKVELPEWHTPSDEKGSFSWPSSPSSSSHLSVGSSSSRHSLTPITPISAGQVGNGNAFNFSLTNALANKRDSFGKNLISASSSLKAELHTLLEEDEEEEEAVEHEYEDAIDVTYSDGNKTEVPIYVQEPERMATLTSEEDDIIAQVDVPPAPVTTGSLIVIPATPQVNPSAPVSTIYSPPRPKPSLKPLSLVAAHHPIATPTISPSPRLKSLTLASNLQIQNNQNQNSNATATPPLTKNAGRGSSLLMTNGAATPLTPSSSPSSKSTTMATAQKQLRRRSSIGYRRGSSSSSLTNSSSEIVPPTRRNSKRQSLPITPGITPVSAARSMTPTTPSDSFSSSRASSEFFHTQAVSSLLGRIASLEEALQTAATTPATSKYGPYPLTPESTSSPEVDRQICNHEPVDELISCIADLKSERDELAGDISGWRTRCGDLERSCDTFGSRFAEQRKELWLVQDRIGVLDAEVQAERALRTKLEMDLTHEKAAMDTERKARMRSEEAMNSERAEWVREEMQFEGQRLKWAKERRGWEMERELLAGERKMMEDVVLGKDAMIKALEERVKEVERMMQAAGISSSDLSMTPKATGSWNDVPTSSRAAFPLQSSIPTSPFTAKKAPGTLNTGFKFGGAPKSAFSSAIPETDRTPTTSSIPLTKVSSPTTDMGFALDAVVEEREGEDEEEDALQGYEDEEDGDVSFSCHGSDDFSDDQNTTITAIPTPVFDLAPISSAAPLIPQQTRPSPAMTSAIPQPSHGHRRSMSTIQKWRFPVTTSRRTTGNNTVMKTRPVDPFFACLESEEEGGAVERITAVGREMKAKEHKKLPSGCPAFWLDCDESDTVLVSSSKPLPSPAMTDEEDNGAAFELVAITPVTADSECDEVRDLPPRTSDASTPPSPFPVVARPAAASRSQTIQTPPARTATIVAPVSRPLSSSSTRVSLSRPPQAAPPSRARVVPGPSFIPSQTGVGLQSPVRSVPPAAIPTMTIPPTVHMEGMGSPPRAKQASIPAYSFYDVAPTTPATPPSAPATSSLSFTSRFQSLSSMIWSTKQTPPSTPIRQSIAPEGEDRNTEVTQEHAPDTCFVPSSISPAKSMTMNRSSSIGQKLVDPSVMRERLRVRLQKEGRLSSTATRSVVGPSQMESCWNCHATGVVEL